MQRNIMKEKVLRGEPCIGASIGMPSPEIVEFCGWLGFDYVFIDAEHGPIGFPECQAMVRACEARGMSSMVRVPKLDHSLIAKYLETRVLAVAVPHINTPEQAELAVKSARYAPLGRRGCDAGASRSSAYGLEESSREYFARSNEEILVAVWIEEVEAIENLDAILQVPGVDVVNFGPGDLALSMGLPGQSDHPDVQAAVAEGRKKVVEAGKVLIAEPGDVASAQEALAHGALLLTSDVQGMWARVTRAYLDEVRGEEREHAEIAAA
jgi:4-hydroxy-2-oxoheptanedioate aldolase